MAGSLVGMAILLITKGPDAGHKFPLEGEVIVLGRQQDCGICLPAKAVSRQHAQMVRTPAGFEIEDLDSSNGTFLNGSRLAVHNRVAIADKDTIGIGPYVLGLRALPTPAETEANLIIREEVSAVSLQQSGFGQDAAQKLQTVLEISQHLSRTLDIDARSRQVARAADATVSAS